MMTTIIKDNPVASLDEIINQNARTTDKEQPTKYYKYLTTTNIDILYEDFWKRPEFHIWKYARVPSNHSKINDTMFIEFVTGEFVFKLEEIDAF